MNCDDEDHVETVSWMEIAKRQKICGNGQRVQCMIEAPGVDEDHL